MQELIKYIVENIVNHPDDVIITEAESSNDNFKTYNIKVNDEDIGLIIGKGGKTIRAVKDVIKAKAIRENIFVDLKVLREDDQIPTS